MTSHCQGLFLDHVLLIFFDSFHGMGLHGLYFVGPKSGMQQVELIKDCRFLSTWEKQHREQIRPLESSRVSGASGAERCRAVLWMVPDGFPMEQFRPWNPSSCARCTATAPIPHKGWRRRLRVACAVMNYE